MAKPEETASKPDFPLAITNSTADAATAATTCVTAYGAHVAPPEPPAQRQADGDGGVEVAAADVPDGVGHRQHGQAEREGHAQESDPDVGHTGREDGRAAASEDQHEGAEELGGESLGQRVFVHASSVWLPGRWVLTGSG